MAFARVRNLHLEKWPNRIHMYVIKVLLQSSILLRLMQEKGLPFLIFILDLYKMRTIFDLPYLYSCFCHSSEDGNPMMDNSRSSPPQWSLFLHFSYNSIDIIVAKSFSLKFCKLFFRWGNTVSLKHYSQSFSIINTTYKMIDHRLDFTIFCYEIHTNQRNTLSFDDRSLNHGLNSHISLQVFSRTRSENFRRYSSYHTPLKSSPYEACLYSLHTKTKSQTRIYVRANDIWLINIFSHEIKHLTHHGRIITSLSELTLESW